MFFFIFLPPPCIYIKIKLKFRSKLLNFYSILRVFLTSNVCVFSLDSECQKVCSGLQDSSQYFVRFQQYCDLNSLDSSSDFFQFQSLFNPMGTIPSTPATISITVIRIFHSFSSFLARSKNFLIFTLSFIFTQWSIGATESTRQQILFF